MSTEIERLVSEAIGSVEEFSESWGDYVDSSEFMRDTPEFFGSYAGALIGVYSMIYDRDDGRYRPVYQHEADLRRVRAYSWVLSEHIPAAKAWVQRLVDYTIGTGFDFVIKCEQNEKLGKAAYRWVDNCLQNSRWSSGLERESFSREIVDGEFLGAIEFESGSLRIATREGDELTEPQRAEDLNDWLQIEDYVPSWSFGVLSDRRAPAFPKGFHVVRDETGRDWEFWPDSEFLFWKRNTRLSAKRGVGDFFVPQMYLCRADRTLMNTADGAATQASIAYIVEHAQGTTRSQVESIRNSNVYSQRYNARTGSAETSRLFKGAKRLDVPNGQKYQAGLLGSNNSQIYIEVIEACLRLAGTVHAFPEGMLTGSYENNNFASSLVAESPFVQGRVADQASRAQQNRAMFEKIIRIGIKHGVFKEFGLHPEDCEKPLPLTVESLPAKVFPRDIEKMTTALKAQREMGWVSDKTAMTELGRDYQAEVSAGAKPGGVDPNAEQNPSVNPGQAGAAAGNVASAGRGGWMDRNKRDLTRYVDLINRVLDQLTKKETTETKARVVLRSINMPDEDIELLLQDARDGKIDSPMPAAPPAGQDPGQKVATLPPAKPMRESIRERREKKAALVYAKLRDERRSAFLSELKEEFDPTQPRAKDGKWIDAGVDTSKWKQTNSAAQWGMKKIAAMKKMAALGEWDKLEQAYTVKATGKPSQYQKGVAQAKANLLAMKGDQLLQSPKGAVDVPGTPAKAGWVKVGESLGTEKGGTYIGPDGKKYYVKTPDNPERAYNEVLASKLYAAAGGKAVPAELIMVDGKEAVATEWASDAKKIDWANDSEMKVKAQEDFAVHAWLGNWDAIGAGFENPMDNVKAIKGEAYLVDAGGSLEFKGMGGGGKKPFGPEVGELKTLKDSGINPSAAAVFGGMTADQTMASMAKLKAVTDADIDAMVGKYKMGDEGAKAAMATILKQRRDFILAKYDQYVAAKELATKVVAEASENAGGKEALKAKIKDAISDSGLMKDGKGTKNDGEKAEAPETNGQASLTAATAEIGATAFPAKPEIKSVANKSAQKKIDALHAAAMSGDIEAVKAIATNAESQQTYAKMHHKYKMQLLAAMENGAKPSAVSESPKASGLAAKIASLPDTTSKFVVNSYGSVKYSDGSFTHFKSSLDGMTSTWNQHLSGPMDSESVYLAFASISPADHDDLAGAIKVKHPGLADAVDASHAYYKAESSKPGALSDGEIAILKKKAIGFFSTPGSDYEQIDALAKAGDLVGLANFKPDAADFAVNSYKKKIQTAMISKEVVGAIKQDPYDSYPTPPMPEAGSAVGGSKKSTEAATVASKPAKMGLKLTDTGALYDSQGNKVDFLTTDGTVSNAVPKILASSSEMDSDDVKLMFTAIHPGDHGKLAEAILLKNPKLGAAVAEAAADWGTQSKIPEMGGPAFEAAKVATSPGASWLKTKALKQAEFPAQPTFQSSNADQVKANEDSVMAINAAASKGDLDGVLKVSSPSPKVQAYQKQVTDAMTNTNTVADVAAQLDGIKVSKVAVDKVGFWKVSKTTVSVSKPAGKWFVGLMEDGLQSQGKNLYDTKLNTQEKSALVDYTGSYYDNMNELLRGIKYTGSEQGTDENRVKNAVSALKKANMELDSGLMLSRKYEVDLSKHNLQVGTVVRENGILSTSTDPSVWSGNVHWRIVTGPGVRGLPAKFFSGTSASEREVLMVPNQEFVITAINDVGGIRYVDAYALPTDIDEIGDYEGE